MTFPRRTALTTGANSGSDWLSATGLANEGLQVWLGSRDPARGENAAAALVANGHDVRPIEIDVTDDANVAAPAARLGEEVEALNVPVNNAGIIRSQTTPRLTTIDHMKAVYKVNVFGPVRVTQAILPLLKQAARPGGHDEQRAGIAWARNAVAPGNVATDINGERERFHPRKAQKPRSGWVSSTMTVQTEPSLAPTAANPDESRKNLMILEGSKMQHIIFSQLGGPEVLETLPLELPPLAPDEVGVKITAIGLNRFDALFRMDNYAVSPVLPSAMGSEAVGVVTGVGGDVPDCVVGDRVTIMPTFSPIVGTGTYATHANVPASTVIRSIEGTSDVEEAALWMASLQAYNMLTKYPIKAGDIVLLTAATSAVGTALIQIARDFGATVIATSRRSDRASQLLELGANHVIATDEEDLVGRVSEITDGQGAILACETVGGALLERVALSVAAGGHILCYGAQTSPDIKAARVDVQLLALDRRSLTFVDLFELTEVPDRFAAAKVYFRDAVARGALKPTVDRVFPFEEIVEAHRHLEAGSLFGKVVVTVG